MDSDRPAPIAIFTLGGTIASSERDDASAGVTPSLSAEELAGALGSPEGLGPFKAKSLRQQPSGDLGFADIAEVADLVGAALADGARGVVVVQGTDTLEETAFLLDLLLSPERPVVVTGALRNPTLPGADGPANLLAAVRVAASPVAAGLGVVVVMNDEIHAARLVRKTHAHLTSAFTSPSTGPLGWVAEDRVRIVTRLAARLPSLTWRGHAPEVPVVLLGLGSTAAAFAGLDSPSVAGVVIAGFGVGHAPASTVDAIAALAARRPVVLASRTGAGEVFRGTYGYAGSERDLLARGCISAGALDPLKARILLTLLLGERSDRAAIAAAFDRI